MNEYAGCSTKLSRVAQRANDEMRDLLHELAEDGGATDPDILAEQLQILLEESTVLAQSGSGEAIMDPAKIMVRDLIGRALPNKAARK